MTEKCEWCEGTKVDPVFGGPCLWCDETGAKNGLASAIRDTVTHGTSLLLVSPEGVEHVPLKDTLVNLKPFRLLPYGTQFRYQGTQGVWVRTGHNLVAEWPSRISAGDGTPIQSLCSFCHLDGDEDGNTLDTPVEVVEPHAELAALREALATAKRNEHNSEVAYKAAIEKQDELREDLRNMTDLATSRGNRVDALRERLTAAEQRNAVMSELLVACRLEFSTSEANAWEVAMRDMIDAALAKPTESGASE